MTIDAKRLDELDRDALLRAGHKTPPTAVEVHLGIIMIPPRGGSSQDTGIALSGLPIER